MQKTRNYGARRSELRRGAITTLVALMLPMLVILAAFAMNFAYMELTRTQAMIAADASARAGGRTFALTGSLANAKLNAQNAANRNLIAGSALTLRDSDFITGISTRATSADRFNFSPSTNNPNSLKVVINRSSSGINGGISHLFPNIFGASSFEITRTSVSTRVDVDIAFVMDRSGSMAFAANEVSTPINIPVNAPTGWFFGDPAPPLSRWLDLDNAARAFLTELSSSPVNEQVALVTYGSSASIDRSMTGNYAQIQSGLSFYTNSFPSGATNIGDGLNKGASALGGGRNFASKVIVLMTDGRRTPGLGPNPVNVATNLAKQGVIIFTVTFSDEAEQNEMRNVANAGMGKHFHAVDAASLTTVFETIARTIPTILTQ
jgi:Ca-activated chloride channel homolog